MKLITSHAAKAVLLFLFMIASLVSRVQSQVYFLGNTAASGGWYQLGTLNLGQQGYDAVIRIFAGYGYNASNAQIGDCIIRVRTSNGSASDNGFYAAAYYYNTGYVRLVNALKIEQIDLSNWRIYAQLPNYTGMGCRLELQALSATWTPGFVATANPAGKDITEKMMLSSPVESITSTKTARLFAGNATTRANARNSLNSFNVGSDAGVTTGWIAADLGGTDNSDRLVIGTGYGGKPIIGTHNGDLTAWGTQPLLINPYGANVGIGTLNATQLLSVKGTILATKVKVSPATNTTDWPDYVFDSAYHLPALSEVEAYVKANKHLPDVPSAEAVVKEGVDLGEMQKLLLKKMEEMTLHMIAQERRLKLQEAKIQQLEQQLKQKTRQ